MKLSDFDYNLPKNLIAQKSAKPRDHSRLMILNCHCEQPKKTRQFQINHQRFYNIEKFLRAGDVLVLNNSKVIPARILARKQITGLPAEASAKVGGKVEILLLRKIDNNGLWETMLRNFKEKEIKKELVINLRTSQDLRLKAVVRKNIGEGIWQVKFNKKGKELSRLINLLGEAPIPPYVKNKITLKDYQTAYAKVEGSVAAPTAGFHFTPRLISKLKKKGIMFEYITLHIGLGTFLPIKVGNIEKHKMHFEYAEINKKTADAINKAKKEGRRIIAVGTTSARTLEAFADKNGKIKASQKEVDLFIKPGYKFKIIKGLITNFHLPKTTLLILVSAFAGKKNTLQAYRKAIKRKYRFYSFGDAMFII